MKDPKFKLFLGFGFGILLFIWASYGSLIRYGLQSAYGQFKILLLAESNEKVLSSPQWTTDQKRKIKLIEDVKKFGVSQLGLIDNGNFENIFDQKGKPLVWVVTGCKPYSFEEKKWNFPFIGNLSYKGFFNLEEAKQEAIQLHMEGWETGIGKVSGWSTLGWFHDPILSSMLTKEDGSLVALILHEMVHGTVYLGSDVDYSENLADFIGNNGAIAYFKYRNDTINLYKFKETLYAEKVVNSYYMNYKDSLTILYKTTPRQDLEKEKRKVFRNIYRGLFFLAIPKNEKLKYIKSGKYMYWEGNDYIMSFSRYGKLQDSLEKNFNKNYQGNLRHFLEEIKKQAN
jgi:predicted aminopeptidase